MDNFSDERTDESDHESETEVPIASLADCYSFDPVMNDSARRLVTEDADRRHHRLT